mgnify:CR=1 FL=1
MTVAEKLFSPPCTRTKEERKRDAGARDRIREMDGRNGERIREKERRKEGEGKCSMEFDGEMKREGESE